jgi:hypothetical protein
MKVIKTIKGRQSRIDRAESRATASPKAKAKVTKSKNKTTPYKPAAKHVASRKAKIAAARAADLRAIAAKRKK